MSSGSPDPGRLSGKSAIVTGGGRGIGKAIAERFAREGARVVIAEIDGPVGLAVARELDPEGAVIVAEQVDVSEPEQVQRLVSRTVDRLGKLDVIVNNAAIASFPFAANLSELPFSSWRTMMSKNLDSVLLASQAAARAMRDTGGGFIVNISSMAVLTTYPYVAYKATKAAMVSFTEQLAYQNAQYGIRANVILPGLSVPGLSAYQVAKGAVVTLTRSLAIDLAPYGIVVNGIAPGWIDTRHNVETMATDEWKRTFLDSGRIPLRRAGVPSEIASMALALCTSDCSYMTGQTLLVDGGLNLTL